MLNLNATDLKRAWFQIMNDKINLIIHDHSQVKDMKNCTHARLRHAFTTFDQMLDDCFGLGASTRYPYLYRMAQVILNERVDKFLYLAEKSEKASKPIQYAREDSKTLVVFTSVIKILEGDMGYTPEENDLPVNDLVLFQILKIKKICMSSLIESNSKVKKQVEQESVKKVAPKKRKIEAPVKTIKKTPVVRVANPKLGKKVHKLF